MTEHSLSLFRSVHKQWTRWAYQFDAIKMFLITGSCFVDGSRKDDVVIDSEFAFHKFLDQCLFPPSRTKSDCNWITLRNLVNWKCIWPFFSSPVLPLVKVNSLSIFFSYRAWNRNPAHLSSLLLACSGLDWLAFFSLCCPNMCTHQEEAGSSLRQTLKIPLKRGDQFRFRKFSKTNVYFRNFLWVWAERERKHWARASEHINSIFINVEQFSQHLRFIR